VPIPETHKPFFDESLFQFALKAAVKDQRKQANRGAEMQVEKKIGNIETQLWPRY